MRFNTLGLGCLLVLLYQPVTATVCDRTANGSSFNLQADQEIAGCTFIALDPLFYTLLEGTNSSKDLLLENELPIFHEGPVLFENELYFTTNRLGNTSLGPTWGATAPLQLDQFIDIYKLDLTTLELTVLQTNPPILMANGMVKAPDGRNILALSQGFNDTGGGVYEIDRETLQVTTIVDNFYGLSFNSLNDIQTTATDNILFFSDPSYGFEQGFRYGNPQLGSNVYRYDAAQQSLQVLVTQLQRPNGVALVDNRPSGGRCTLYLTDSGFEAAPPGAAAIQQSRGFGAWGDSAVYSLTETSDEGCFAPSDILPVLAPLVPVARGIQDGIRVHHATQLLLYCDGNGVWIWHLQTHTPLGIIVGGCTQLIFDDVPGLQTVYILAEQQLFAVELNFDVDALTVEGDPVLSFTSGAWDWSMGWLTAVRMLCLVVGW